MPVKEVPPKAHKPFKKVKAVDFKESDFPASTDPALRTKALALIGVANDPTKTLEEKLGIVYDNSAMLGDSKKKLTTADRIRTLLQQENFSPFTKLIRLAKIEEAKMEAWNRAESYGLAPELMDSLPKPDKKFYATLLLQLARYEVPELKSVEVHGEVEMGMTVQVINSVPQQKVIRVDANAPAKLRELFGTDSKALDIKATEVAVTVVEDEL